MADTNFDAIFSSFENLSQNPEIKAYLASAMQDGKMSRHEARHINRMAGGFMNGRARATMRGYFNGRADAQAEKAAQQAAPSQGMFQIHDFWRNPTWQNMMDLKNQGQATTQQAAPTSETPAKTDVWTSHNGTRYWTQNGEVTDYSADKYNIAGKLVDNADFAAQKQKAGNGTFAWGGHQWYGQTYRGSRPVRSATRRVSGGATRPASTRQAAASQTTARQAAKPVLFKLMNNYRGADGTLYNYENPRWGTAMVQGRHQVIKDSDLGKYDVVDISGSGDYSTPQYGTMSQIRNGNGQYVVTVAGKNTKVGERYIKKRGNNGTHSWQRV